MAHEPPRRVFARRQQVVFVVLVTKTRGYRFPRFVFRFSIFWVFPFLFFFGFVSFFVILPYYTRSTARRIARDNEHTRSSSCDRISRAKHVPETIELNNDFCFCLREKIRFFLAYPSRIPCNGSSFINWFVVCRVHKKPLPLWRVTAIIITKQSFFFP